MDDVSRPIEIKEVCRGCAGHGVTAFEGCNPCNGLGETITYVCPVDAMGRLCNALVLPLAPRVRSNTHVYVCLNGHRWARTFQFGAAARWERVADVDPDLLTIPMTAGVA